MFEQLLECYIMTATLVHYLALYIDDMFIQLGASMMSQNNIGHAQSITSVAAILGGKYSI